MLKREITYENPFTGASVTEEHYFHISKADLVEMEIEEHGETYVKDGEEMTGMQARLQKIVDSEDGKAILQEFKDIIRRSYGRKEGERFVKNEENWKDFAASEAFSQLLFELCTNPDAAGDFINGVVPANLDKIAAEVQEQAEKITAGRAAQDAAKAAAGTSEGATPATEEIAATPESSRAAEIVNATSENPITLTEAEIRDMDSEAFRSGIADGRFKMATA